MIRFFIIIGILISSIVASAWQDPLPPLNNETIIGVWEAVPEDARLLYHMEIKKKGESYLALFFHPKSPYYSIFRLVSSNIKNGNIKLHFHLLFPKEDALTDLWIEGKGVGYAEDGNIKGTIAGNGEHQNKQAILFMKGTWTRRLAELSQKAESAIKAKNSEASSP
jgi:hypothetical protein